MYEVGASPLLGADHVNVTLLPDEDATRFVGRPGAVAAAVATACGPTRGPEKHDDVRDPDRHSAKLIFEEATDVVIVPNPVALVAVGSEGALNVPQLATSKAVAREAEKPGASRRIGIL